jgi:hypothetical protein
MEFSESRASWTMQQLLCYLSCTSRDWADFLGGKALGVIPPRRESLQRFARALNNISTLLLFASSKLIDTMLKPRRRDELLCLASLPQLVEICELLQPVFREFIEDITRWARDKTPRTAFYFANNYRGIRASPLMSPLNLERYELMDKLISFAEVSIFRILYELRPVLGSHFGTASYW